MRAAVIRNGAFVGFDATTQPDTLGRIPEVAVFEPVGGDVSAVLRHGSVRLPRLGDVARIALAVFGAGVVIAIVSFCAWLIARDSGPQSALGFAAGQDCQAMGRAGAYCHKSAAISPSSNRGVGPQEECTSLGRAGLVCVRRPANADRSIHQTGT
jgi:hypothetical protein